MIFISSLVPATGGMEAAVVNMLSPGDPILAVSIGVFGDRFANIATAFGAKVTKSSSKWVKLLIRKRSSASFKRQPGYQGCFDYP